MPDLSGSRAVLIGSSVYDAETLPNVPQAANSLRAMSWMLTSSYCDWPDNSVTVISNGTSAEHALVTINNSAREVEDGGALLIYFVGHGHRINDGRELCLAMPTTMTEPRELLEQTSLPISRVKGVINDALKQKPRTTKILILDCCYSGTAVLDAGDRLPDVDAGGMFVLTASLAHQLAAFAPNPAGMTHFTQCLTDVVKKGILNKSAGLTLMDIYDALPPRLRVLTKHSGDLLQVPDAMATRQASRFVFAHNVAVVPELQALPLPDDIFLGPLPEPKPKKPRREPTPPPTSPPTPTRRTLLAVAGTAAVTGIGTWLLTEGRNHAATPQSGSSSSGAVAATTGASTNPPTTTPQTSSPSGSNTAAPSHAAPGDVPTSVSPLSGSFKTQNGFLYDVAFAPHGKNLLASSCADGTVQLWTLADPSQPTPAGLLKPNQGSLSPLAFHPAGHILAAASSDGQYASIVLWDVSNAAKPALLKTWKAHNDSVNGLAFSPDGSTLASCSIDSTVILWNLTNPANPVSKIVLQSPDNRSWQSVAYSPKGDLVAGGSWDDVIYLWNPSESQPRMKLSGHTNTVFSLAFSADGQRLVSGSIDGTVRVWDMSDPAKTQSRSTVLTSDMGGAQAVAVSASGILAAGFVDAPGTVLLWNLGASGGPAPLGQRLNPFGSSVMAVAFSDDGRLLAGSSADWSMRLWQLS